MKLTRIIPVFVIVLWFTAACGRVISQTGSPKTRSIRQIEFSDFTFIRQDSAETIPLRNGRYEGSNDHSYWLMNTAYGDLTGDGIEEAIVLLRGQNTRTSPTQDEVFIYALKDEKAVLLTNFEGGKRREYLVSVAPGGNFKVEDHLLVVDRAVLTDEHEYAPTHYYTIKYRWNGSHMVEVERSALKLLPPSMMEIG